MTWQLVILLLSSTEGATLSGAEQLRFHTEQACLTAGRKMADELNYKTTTRLRISCIEVPTELQGD